MPRPGPGGEKRIGGRASHHEACEALGALLLLLYAATGVSLRAVECLSGATPRGPPWTPAMAQPQGYAGLSARRMAVVWTCHKPSLCRRVHLLYLQLLATKAMTSRQPVGLEIEQLPLEYRVSLALVAVLAV